MTFDPTDYNCSLRVIMMPRDTNQYGTIFGGVLLSYIDQAAFAETLRHGRHRWVTASIDRVNFKHPVHVGDTVEFHTRPTKMGRTSIQVLIEVVAERYTTGRRIEVTCARMTMVAVNEHAEPVPYTDPPTIHLDSDDTETDTEMGT